jgi:membrane fusion protein (multidrug efflux system)
MSGHLRPITFKKVDMHRFSSRCAIVLAVTLLAPAFALAQQAAGQPISVGTVVATKQPVNQATEFVGRIEAIDRVDVRARVTGFLQEIYFKEGETVKEGSRLFLIDPAPFEAALQQARGAVLQAQGTLTNAIAQRVRADELIKTGATSVAVQDERLAAEQNAQGGLAIAQANERTATINLGYTTVLAPITGRIGRTKITKGNVVGPDTGSLALIVRQDPMFVTFPVSQREFLRLRQEGSQKTRANYVVKLRFSDGAVYDQDGEIDFVDVTVDRGTDTIMVRARVGNPAGALTDGQFMRVAVQRDEAEEKVVIPQAAILADQEGTYVYAVQDGKAVVKRIKTGPEVGAGIAIEQGLSGGEVIVTFGLQFLRPGAPVAASPVPSANPASPAKGG